MTTKTDKIMKTELYELNQEERINTMGETIKAASVGEGCTKREEFLNIITEHPELFETALSLVTKHLSQFIFNENKNTKAKGVF